MKVRKKHTHTHIVLVTVIDRGYGVRENICCAIDSHESGKHCCDDRQHHRRDNLQRYNDIIEMVTIDTKSPNPKCIK